MNQSTDLSLHYHIKFNYHIVMNQAQMKSQGDFSRRLLKWYESHGRKSLPWHENRDPYRIWVSEIMLQQTQVSTAAPFYQRFIARFPDVVALADATEDDVLHHWSGLGYYARARNLHKAAKQIRDHHDGHFPARFDEVIALPGIGRSTAGAILAFSFNQRHPILDGNVKRVLTRYLAIEGYPGKKTIENKLWEIADQFTPDTRVGHYTQAIMDLGATLCTRTRPLCDLCPITDDCAANAQGRQGEFPHRKPRVERPVKHTMMLLVKNNDNQILLKKRPPSGIWGGLWSLPEVGPDIDDIPAWCADNLGLVVEPGETLGNVRHVFSHYELQIKPVTCRLQGYSNQVKEDSTLKWYDPHSGANIGLPGVLSKIFALTTLTPLSKSAEL